MEGIAYKLKTEDIEVYYDDQYGEGKWEALDCDSKDTITKTVGVALSFMAPDIIRDTLMLVESEAESEHYGCTCAGSIVDATGSCIHTV